MDYRRLNDVTRKDSYPLLRIDDALDYIGGGGLAGGAGPRGQTKDRIHHRAGVVAVPGHAVRAVQRAGYVRADDGEGNGGRPPESLCRVPWGTW